MSELALIPARSGSRGCVGKNLRTLGGRTLIQRAIMCAVQGGVWPVYVSTDIPHETWERDSIEAYHIQRPAELAQDSTPMLDVVKHALQAIPGPDDQIVVLLQPTQPFRRPEHIQQAITLLRESGADSVVSVVKVPPTQSPELLCWIGDLSRYLCPFDVMRGLLGGEPRDWSIVPTRRQDTKGGWYRRDGTVYAFRRATVEQKGSIYGNVVRPLIIDPADSCELDSESDWREVERRWKEQHEVR